MYKVYNNLVPSYIKDIIPPQRNQQQNYQLRNNEDINLVKTRTTLFKKSCIPSAISLWNSLDTNVRSSTSLPSFKNITCSNPNKIGGNHLFLFGKRYISVLHARIRNGCSDLNFDLYNNHLRDSPQCDCSERLETSDHYFFQCNKYNAKRVLLFQTTRSLHPLNINLLLQGGEQLSYDDNVLIFEANQEFIKSSERFRH